MNWFLQWFDHNLFLFYLIALGALFIFLFLALLPSAAGSKASRAEWAFLISIVVVLFAWRWPAFCFPRHLQPDEGLWIAGALKTTVDPVPWRGVDSTTSGPLNNYLLALPVLFGARISFFSMRLIGSVLIALTMCALYYAIKWIHGERIARLGIVPGTVMLSLSGEPDFVAFTSEYLPVFMTTVVLAATVYLARGSGSYRARVSAAAVAGLFLGAAGFSKLQAAPIIITIFAFGAAFLLFEAISKTKWAATLLLPHSATTKAEIPASFTARARRKLGDLAEKQRYHKNTKPVIITGLLALSLPPAVFLIWLWLAGTLADAIASYIKMPLARVLEGGHVHLAYFFGFARAYPLRSFAAFLVSAIVAVVIGLAALLSKGGCNFKRPFATLYPVLLVIAGFFAIAQAHREFPHYLWFAVIPVSCCMAAVLGLTSEANLWQRREAMIAILFIALCVLPQLSVAMSRPGSFPANVVANYNSPPSAVARAISRYATPGTRIAIWGWAPEYYIDTGTIMATRDAETAYQAGWPNKYREYYRRRYIRDLQADLPPVFVDGVAPGNFYHNRATKGYETFPALASLVREHYELKEEVAGVRIFTLRGLLSESRSTSSSLKPETAPFASSHSIPIEEITALNEVVLTPEDDHLRIHATGNDPQLLLPSIQVGERSISALGVEIEAPADTNAQLYYQTLQMARFTGLHQVTAPLKKGPNNIWLKINEAGINGRLRLDPGTIAGEYILHAVIFSSFDPTP